MFDRNDDSVKQALEHMTHAMRHYHAGDHDKAEHHARLSESHFNTYKQKAAQTVAPEVVKKLEMVQSEVYSHFHKLLASARRMNKAEPKQEPKADVTYPVHKDPAKASDASIARREFNAKGVIDSKVEINRTPGMDPRYKYKGLHELSEKDRIKAHYAYNGKDMDSHHYPVDEAGNLVHATRAKLPHADKVVGPGKQPEANTTYGKPEHAPGADVVIEAEGHEHHGRRGVVKLPNPNMEGKIRVHLGHTVTYVDPGQVRLRKSDEDEALLEKVAKARGVLELLRKAESVPA